MGAEVVRIEGWERLLNEHISEGYERGFSWGENDCALWCARWVHKATGEDLFSDWTGKYKSAKGAALTMKRRGFSDAEAVADAALLSLPVTLAHRGDIVLEHVGGPLGICNGRHSHFLTAESMTLRETLGCVKAWRV